MKAAGDGLAAELAEHCRARLAAAKVPVRWLVTGSFPMTASGKIRKDVLRDQLSEASAEARAWQLEARAAGLFLVFWLFR